MKYTSHGTPASMRESTWRFTKIPYFGLPEWGHMLVTTSTRAAGSEWTSVSREDGISGGPGPNHGLGWPGSAIVAARERPECGRRQD